MLLPIFKHADHCRSPPALEVTHLAENPLVQRIVREAHSHDTVKEMVRGMTGVQLTASDVTRLAQTVADKYKALHSSEYALLIPELTAMQVHQDFGAELIVRLTSGATESLLFGCFKPAGAIRSPDAQLAGARILHLVILWPWARRVEGLGPPIVGADAMHLKEKQGQLYNVAMRVAKHYVTLLSQWSATEDGEGWRRILRWGKKMLKLLDATSAAHLDRVGQGSGIAERCGG